MCVSLLFAALRRDTRTPGVEKAQNGIGTCKFEIQGLKKSCAVPLGFLSQPFDDDDDDDFIVIMLCC